MVQYYHWNHVNLDKYLVLHSIQLLFIIWIGQFFYLFSLVNKISHLKCMVDIRCTYTLTFKVYTLWFLLQTLATKRHYMIQLSFFPVKYYHYLFTRKYNPSNIYIYVHRLDKLTLLFIAKCVALFLNHEYKAWINML